MSVKKKRQTEEDESDNEEISLAAGNDIELMQVDFEAFPMHCDDRLGIVKMLSQIFLKAKIDLDELAKLLIKQCPVGSVFRPTEEYSLEECEDDVYGMISVVNLHADEKCMRCVLGHLKTRVQKAVPKEVLQKLMTEVIEPEEGRKIGFIVSERLLNLPSEIACPAFRALVNDMNEANVLLSYSHFVTILKVHLSDKSAVGGPDVVYTNTEDEQLFANCCFSVDYPVQSETEQNSLLAVFTGEDNQVYRPYRRVCLIEKNQFLQFVDALSPT